MQSCCSEFVTIPLVCTATEVFFSSVFQVVDPCCVRDLFYPLNRPRQCPWFACFLESVPRVETLNFAAALTDDTTSPMYSWQMVSYNSHEHLYDM